jgi:hypothetical protein
MKKLQIVLLVSVFIFAAGCSKKEDGGGEKTPPKGNVGSTITNVHAPTSGTDSITFTADTSALQLMVFSPLGGMNHVFVHDATANTDLFNSDVSTADLTISGFIAGDNYMIMCYSGHGTSANFSHVASSFRNSGASPSPFAGYTQYYNNSNTQGPSDGVVVIIAEEPATGSKKGK